MLSLSVKQAAPWILNLSDLSYPTSLQTQTISIIFIHFPFLPLLMLHPVPSIAFAAANTRAILGLL
jgi:hypothetical protein